MIEYFKVFYSDEVGVFLESLDEQTRRKIIYNIDKSRLTLDPKLFKKLTDDIWEFRTKFKSIQYRLLAFWDKRDRIADYSTYPLAEPDVQISRIRFLSITFCYLSA